MEMAYSSWFWCFINLWLTYLDTYPLTYSPRAPSHIMKHIYSRKMSNLRNWKSLSFLQMLFLQQCERIFYLVFRLPLLAHTNVCYNICDINSKITTTAGATATTNTRNAQKVICPVIRLVNIRYYRIIAPGKQVTKTEHRLILQLLSGHVRSYREAF